MKISKTGTIALLAAALLISGLANAGPKDKPAGKGNAVVELLIIIPGGGNGDGVASATLEELQGLGTFNVDSFFDIDYAVVSNIGSSGMDGVRAGGGDSFFDISYSVNEKANFSLLRVSMRGTINVANPALVLEEVDRVLGDKKYKHRGHVTVLK